MVQLTINRGDWRRMPRATGIAAVTALALALFALSITARFGSSELESYATPALDSAGHRIQLQVPVGWNLSRRVPVEIWSMEGEALRPRTALSWVPDLVRRWLHVPESHHRLVILLGNRNALGTRTARYTVHELHPHPGEPSVWAATGTGIVNNIAWSVTYYGDSRAEVDRNAPRVLESVHVQ